MEKLKNFFKSKYIYILSFILPLAILAFIFSRKGVFPFGDNQIIIQDGVHQYFPFLKELHRKLLSGDNILFSWNLGSGFPYYNIFAYYTASPLNLLLYFIPEDFTIHFYYIITLVKISLASLTMSFYLKKSNEKIKNPLSIVIFALCYSLSAFIAGYYWNIMWLDAFYMLPLIILGVDNLIRHKKFNLYILSLAYAIISNYYMGMILCMFIVVYFIAKNIIYSTDVKTFLKNTLHIFVCSLVACLIASIILIPLSSSMNVKKYYDYGFDVILQKLTVDFKLVLSRLLFYNSPSIVIENYPNIYLGLLNIPLLIFYFISKKTPLKTRLVNLAFISFLLLSFSTGILNYIWNGFRVPNGIPFRFAFVFIFSLIVLSFKGYQIFIENINIKNILTLSIGFALSVFLVLYSNNFTYNLIVKYNLILLFIYFILLFAYKYELSKYLVYGLVMVELTLNFNNYVNQIGVTNYTEYTKNHSDFKELQKNIVQDSFFREDFAHWNTDDDSALLGYKGISLFSSDMNRNWIMFGEYIGFSSHLRNNKSIYADNTPILNSLFNLKYIYSQDKDDKKDTFKHIIDKTDNLSLYENSYPISIGYKVKDYLPLDKLKNKSVFENQNKFLSLTTGKDNEYLSILPSFEENFENIEIEKDNLIYKYKLQDVNKEGNFEFKYKVPKDGKVFIYGLTPTVPLPDRYTYERNVSVRTSDSSTTYNFIRSSIYDLGNYKAGEIITVSAPLQKNIAKDYFNIQLATMNEPMIKSALESLDNNKLNVTSYTSNSLSGTIEAKKDEILFASIVDYNGWEVYINGEKKEKELLYDTFVGVRLEDGTNNIQFKYIPKNFYLGIAMSLFGISALVFKNKNNIKNLIHKNKKIES
ncbi:YfhO family protein [Miniphocaeibacter massiliensis]|uniref:YfhO family protein n=1 Tax=Miniphocaeibacter massiliensis TaxID=2041841 RepID=UPI000C1C41D6|nr:YfhO family protein [Miniphocaeibacter massiliensis]